MRIIVADFAQLVPRPVRDILGQNRLPALRGTPGAGTVTVDLGQPGRQYQRQLQFNSGLSFNSGTPPSPGMSFNSGSVELVSDRRPTRTRFPMVDLTRAGWSNTAGQQRSTLQRVSYALVGDVLKRSYQVNLDTVQGNKPVVQDLLDRRGGRAASLSWIAIRPGKPSGRKRRPFKTARPATAIAARGG